MSVIVIGAGILGASTAYHLARAGVAVTVIDRQDPGRATAAGAGIISPWISATEDPAYYAIAAGGARYYPELLAHLREDGETDLAYRQVGALVVPEAAAELDVVEARLARRRNEAPEMGIVRRLRPAEAQALFPALAPGRAAVHVAGGARMDGRLAAAALLRAAQKRGAVVQEGDAALLTRNGAVHGVRTAAGTLEADQVIVTAGAWAPALLAPLGVALPVQPQRGQIVHLRLRVDTGAWPVLQPMNSYYLLSFDDRRVVVGATRETGSGFDYRVTAAGQAEVLNVALAVAPGLADAELIETRIGFRPMAADGRPLLGPAAGVPGLLIGNGLGHSGLTIGPFAGALLAAVARGEAPPLAMGAYAVDRQQK